MENSRNLLFPHTQFHRWEQVPNIKNPIVIIQMISEDIFEITILIIARASYLHHHELERRRKTIRT